MNGRNKVIGIQPLYEADEGECGGIARALLSEIAEAVSTYIQDHLPKIIDIKAIGLSAPERDVLDEALGRGEISVEIVTAGRSRIEETRFPGVWWVRHYGVNDELQAEWIEVTEVPEIMKADRADMVVGLKNLRDNGSKGG
ncbi:MAG: hydrogenase expression/formation C-terminal domain-containing protein [Acidiferrobacter sp.]